MAQLTNEQLLSELGFTQTATNEAERNIGTHTVVVSWNPHVSHTFTITNYENNDPYAMDDVIPF